MIHVVIPHFKAVKWLIPCLRLLHGNSSGKNLIVYTVITMEECIDCRKNVKTKVGAMAHIVESPMPGMIGGQPLASVLTMGTALHCESDITVTVDPDALILAKNWDRRLIELFTDNEVVCAGINPRSDSEVFHRTPEWNWMAFKTQFWLDHIKSFQPDSTAHDIGHVFKRECIRHNKSYHTWPLKNRPFDGKLASVAGDTNGMWAFHAFYSSRKRYDRIPESERTSILTPDQEDSIICDSLHRSGIQ